MTYYSADWPRAWDQSESTITSVLEAFRLDARAIEVLAPLVSGAGQIRGARVRVDERDWALKRYTSPEAVDRLRTSHSLELRLARYGFPVAPLCTAATGETVVRVGSAWYSLHGWVTGQHVSIADRDGLISERPHLVDDLAAMIATLHTVGSQAPAEGGDPDLGRMLRRPQANVRRIRGSRRRVLTRWQMLRLRPRKSDFDRWALRVLPELATRSQALAAASSAHRVPRSETGLIHNDVNWENLVLDDEFRVRALLDFDHVVRAPWEVEVGACAVVLVGAAPSLVEQFVAGYEMTRGAPLDRELVRLGMELKCVRSITHSIASYLHGYTNPRMIAPWCHHLYGELQQLHTR